MGFSKTHSAHISILQAHIVDIEVDLSVGLYYFSIIGLADKAVEEARDRIGAAIKNSGYVSPKQKNHKVVISLAPASIRKEGPAFDLGMAMAYLLAAKEIEFNPEHRLFLGELSLDGKLRPITGVLALVLEAERQGFKEIFVPKENAEEAALAQGVSIFGAETLLEIILHVNEKELGENETAKAYEEYEKQGSRKPLIPSKLRPHPKVVIAEQLRPSGESNFSFIKGQAGPKRVLEIAAAGKHNVMLYGPPGTGKTMLAQAFVSILPKLSFEEVIECTCIHSISGTKKVPYVCFPPLRAPHHTSSYVSIVGGGSYPKPGEATLAHHGVLFADEFPEFNIQALEALREPLESKVITLSRAKGTAILPADFILIATMNPCPCGYRGSRKKSCTCRPAVIARYRRKLSGPIVDRIGLWVEVGEIDHGLLIEESGEETSETIAKRVLKTRNMRSQRESVCAQEKNPAIHQLSRAAKELLEKSARTLSLSPRLFYKIADIARTVADLEGSKNVETPHVLEALQYRPKEFLLGDT